MNLDALTANRKKNPVEKLSGSGPTTKQNEKRATETGKTHLNNQKQQSRR